MHFDGAEIQAIADALAPRVADILERRFAKDPPDWCFSVSEAAAWAKIPEHVVRQAIEDGRLPCVRLGRQVRIRRADLFAVNGK